MTDSRIRSDAAWLECLAIAALLTVVLGISLQYVVGPVARTLYETWTWTELAGALGVSLIDALPAIVLTGALSATHKVARRLRQGDLFSGAVGAGVKEIGLALIYAAVATAVVVPWLQAWVDGRYGFGGIRLETMTWVLGVVGAAMFMLGRLLGRAAEMQSELESYV